jgi:hypothetical protein
VYLPLIEAISLDREQEASYWGIATWQKLEERVDQRNTYFGQPYLKTASRLKIRSARRTGKSF